MAEIFLDRELMGSAYYAEKIPAYWDEIKSGKRLLRRLSTIKSILWDVIFQYDIKRVYAHNARFDWRSLNLTQRLVTGSKYRYFLPYRVKMCDTLKLSRSVFGNDENYREFCEANGFVCKNGTPRFTAEVLYRYLSGNVDFEEAHTGLADVEIEKDILAACLAADPSLVGYLWSNKGRN